jgi:hypothetical protein
MEGGRCHWAGKRSQADSQETTVVPATEMSCYGLHPDKAPHMRLPIGEYQAGQVLDRVATD